MTELAQLYAQIALLRRGPQDLPAAPVVLGLTILAYFGIKLVLNWLLPQAAGEWVALQVADILFTLVWYALLLRLVRKPERFLQTATAIFGYQAILAPVSISTGWLVRRFGEQQAWQFPLGIVSLIVIVWMIAINSHVLKAALEWSTFLCVLLVVLQICASDALLYLLISLMR